MKAAALVLAAIATAASAASMIARSGTVRFFSTTPLENIEGISSTAVSSIDLDSGKLAIKARNATFIFPVKLMQEHFNENYMESEKYPLSTFSGKFGGLDRQAFDEGKKVAVIVDGMLDVHGIAKHYRTPGFLQKGPNGAVEGETRFFVKIADHGIKIPSVVMAKIADSMEITARFAWHSAEAAK